MIDSFVEENFLEGNPLEEHGGNIYKASKMLNKELNEIFDFSANINPLGIPQKLKEIMISNIQNMVYYPDPKYYKLLSQLSDYLEVPWINIIPGNGSSEIIYLFFKVLKPRDVLITAPSFSEYEKAALNEDVFVRYFKLEEEQGFKLNTRKLMDEISCGVDCVVLCNPNNPTSKLVEKEDMAEIIAHAYRHKTTVLIDEAFIELTEGSKDNSMTDYINTYKNLFIIRAATKIFAVPGLRLGYGIGNKDLIANMKSKQQPWSLNTLAACAGSFLICADDYLKRTSEWLVEEKAWLYKNLVYFFADSSNRADKLKVFNPDTNFILIKLLCTELDSCVLKERLAKRGVLIRDASNFKYLDNRFFRVAVKDRRSNERLINILTEELD